MSLTGMLALLALQRPTWAGWLCAGSVGWLLAIGTGLAPDWLARALQSDQPVRLPVEARCVNLVVLVDGPVERLPSGEVVSDWISSPRILKALTLYQESKARGDRMCLTVAGGAAAAEYGKWLSALGVDPADVSVEPGGRNTYEHSAAIAQSLRRAAGPVWLVTSGLHMKRARMYLAHWGVATLPAPSDVVRSRMSWLPIAYNFAIFDIASHQAVGIARMKIYNALGLNQRGSVR